MEAIFNQADEWLVYHHLQEQVYIIKANALHIIKAQALYKLARLRSDFIFAISKDFIALAISSALADFIERKLTSPPIAEFAKRGQRRN